MSILRRWRTPNTVLPVLKNPRAGLGALLALMSGAFASPQCTAIASAQCTILEDHTVASTTPQPSNFFGSAVASEGAWTVVGAPGSSSLPGFVEVLDYDSALEQWTNTGTILSSSFPETGDRYGSCVAIDQGVVVAGVPGDDLSAALQNAGSAEVWRYDGPVFGWVRDQVLQDLTPAAGNAFGEHVDISGDWLIVGSRGETHSGLDRAGAAYVYNYQGATQKWQEVAQLTAFDAAPIDGYGFSVAIDGAWAVVGSKFDDDSGSASGSVDVYRYISGAWTHFQKLTSSSATSLDQFGYAVAIDGDRLVVSAPWDDEPSVLDPGALYAFSFDGVQWVQEQRLVTTGGLRGDLLGFDVDIDGDRILAGNRHTDEAGADSGSARLFARAGSTWVEEHKYLASTPALGDWFGSGVALADGTAFIGAPRDDFVSTNAGVLLVFPNISEFRLWSSTDDIVGGGPLTFTTGCGQPGQNAWLAVSIPPVIPFRIIHVGQFRADHLFELTLDIPNDLPPFEASFTAFKLDPDGPPVVSNQISVKF